MLIRFTVLFLLSASLAACAHKKYPEGTTPECMTYQHMMTAPMSPDAMNSLKEKCIKSQEADNHRVLL